MRNLVFIIETDNNESYVDVYLDVQERLRSNKFSYSIKEIYSLNEYKKILREQFINELELVMRKLGCNYEWSKCQIVSRSVKTNIEENKKFYV